MGPGPGNWLPGSLNQQSVCSSLDYVMNDRSEQHIWKQRNMW